jgi:hypothetical protein
MRTILIYIAAVVKRRAGGKTPSGLICIKEPASQSAATLS